MIQPHKKKTKLLWTVPLCLDWIGLDYRIWAWSQALGHQRPFSALKWRPSQRKWIARMKRASEKRDSSRTIVCRWSVRTQASVLCNNNKRRPRSLIPSPRKGVYAEGLSCWKALLEAYDTWTIFFFMSFFFTDGDEISTDVFVQL